jgi:hypothetical protein
MKKTTIVISQKVNVPRVRTFKAAAIATSDKKLNFEVTKIGNLGGSRFWYKRRSIARTA